MARFSTAAKIIEVTWNMKLFDLPRSANRARIDRLFNGFPPYTEEEAEENRIDVNFNDLTATKLAHDARGQFNNAFLSPERFFNVRIDTGPRHKRDEWSEIISTEINRRMKRNRLYAENLRDVFRQLVLHGIGPVVWKDRQCWVPQMQMVPDVMLPSRTLLTLENVSYFAVFRRYTAEQLFRMTHGPKVDGAWNVALADRCIQWASKQWGATRSSNDYIYTPEKWQEDIKADQGFYATDALPTIDCWDFYFLNDEDEDNHCWNRRIVLDTPSGSEAGATSNSKGQENITGSKSEFLYDSGDRAYARKMDEIIHFQFADGAVVAPARYHSVRSLGFLLYSICHVQNRLRCRFTAHAFENLIQYFRVADPADMERLTKVDLIDRGVIPTGLSFVTQNERWQVNEGLVSEVLAMNRQSMEDQSVAYTQQHDFQRDRSEKTATQVMAEVNAASTLVSAMLSDAYLYQEPQYREVARRFCIEDSNDLDVKAFRVACLNKGVPPEALNVDAWDIKAERIMGGGNRQMAIAQSELIMQNYTLLDPDAQRVALRNRMFAITGDAAMTQQLVPAQRTEITDSVHDAQVSAAALLAGLPMGLKQGVNHAEYAQALSVAMQSVISGIEARGGMATPEEVLGLQNIAGQDISGQPIPGTNGISGHLQILEQDKGSKQIVRMLGDQLGEMMNMVKAYAQRIEEQIQASGQAMDVEAQAKADAIISQTQAKIQSQQMAAEQKLAQRQQQFEQKMAEAEMRMQAEQEKFRLQLENKVREAEVKTAVEDIKTAADIRRQGQQVTG